MKEEFEDEEYVSEENQIFNRKVRGSFGLLILVFLAVYIGYGLFFNYQKQYIVADASAWGQFGDFVGGVLNPLVAALAFYWLVTSLSEQRNALADTRSIMSRTARNQRTLARQTRKQNQIIEIQIKASVVLRKLEARQTERIGILNRMMALPKPDAEHFMYKNSEGRRNTLSEVVIKLDSLIKQDEHHLETMQDEIKRLNKVPKMQEIYEQIEDGYGV